MITRISVVFALAVLSACSNSPARTVYEIAGGVNVSALMPWSQGLDGGFAGGADTVRFTVRREYADGRRFCGLTHISHLSSGWPVNDRAEDWLDVFECGLRFDSGAR